MCCIVYPCSLFVIAKMCQKKSKVLFYPHSKEKRKNLEKLSTTSRFFLLFNINVCIFIQIHLMLLLIVEKWRAKNVKCFIQIHLMLLLILDADIISWYSSQNSNTSYVIINLSGHFWTFYNFKYSNTSYVIINLGFWLFLVLKKVFKYILCYY